MKQKKKTKRKPRKGRKWRHVYPYSCEHCHKDRIAFNKDRAKSLLCQKCMPTVPDPDQMVLPFAVPIPAAV